MTDMSGMSNLDGKSAIVGGNKTLLTMPDVLSGNLARMTSLEAPATAGPAAVSGAERSVQSNYSALNSNLHLSDESVSGGDEFMFGCLNTIVMDPSGVEWDGMVGDAPNDLRQDRDLGTNPKSTNSSPSPAKTTAQPRNVESWRSPGGSAGSPPQPQEHAAASPASGAAAKLAPSSDAPNLYHAPAGATPRRMYFTPSPAAHEPTPRASADAMLFHLSTSQTHGQSLGEAPGITTSSRPPPSATASNSTTSAPPASSVGAPVYFPFPGEPGAGCVGRGGPPIPAPAHPSYLPVVAMAPGAGPGVGMPNKAPYAPFPVLNDEAFRSNLFICGLSSEVRDRELVEAFSKYGEIESAKVMLDIHSGQSRGIAFVKFKDVKCAEKALLELNGSVLHNSTITVRVANSRAAYIPGTPTNKTFVRNVPLTVSKERLLAYFAQFGEVVEVSVHADTAQGRQSLAEMGNFDPAMHESGPDGLRLNIVFVTFTTKEAAAEAAARTHTTAPFPDCHGTPLLAKVAEDSARRIKRLARRYRPGDGQAPPGDLDALAPGELPKAGPGGGAVLQLAGGGAGAMAMPPVFPGAGGTALAYPQAYYPASVPPYPYLLPPQVREVGQPVMVPLMYMAPPGMAGMAGVPGMAGMAGVPAMAGVPGMAGGLVAPAQAAPGPYYVVMDAKGTGHVMTAHA